MGSIATTKMSSKGQVVIPERVRKSLKLKAGDQFIVIWKNDAVILKTITPPSVDQFDEMLALARKQAKAAGLKRSDIAKVIRRVRAGK